MLNTLSKPLLEIAIMPIAMNSNHSTSIGALTMDVTRRYLSRGNLTSLWKEKVDTAGHRRHIDPFTRYLRSGLNPLYSLHRWSCVTWRYKVVVARPATWPKLGRLQLHPPSRNAALIQPLERAGITKRVNDVFGSIPSSHPSTPTFHRMWLVSNPSQLAPLDTCMKPYPQTRSVHVCRG